MVIVRQRIQIHCDRYEALQMRFHWLRSSCARASHKYLHITSANLTCHEECTREMGACVRNCSACTCTCVSSLRSHRTISGSIAISPIAVRRAPFISRPTRQRRGANRRRTTCTSSSRTSSLLVFCHCWPSPAQRLHRAPASKRPTRGATSTTSPPLSISRRRCSASTIRAPIRRCGRPSSWRCRRTAIIPITRIRTGCSQLPIGSRRRATAGGRRPISMRRRRCASRPASDCRARARC